MTKEIIFDDDALLDYLTKNRIPHTIDDEDFIHIEADLNLNFTQKFYNPLPGTEKISFKRVKTAKSISIKNNSIGAKEIDFEAVSLVQAEDIDGNFGKFITPNLEVVRDLKLVTDEGIDISSLKIANNIDFYTEHPSGISAPSLVKATCIQLWDTTYASFASLKSVAEFHSYAKEVDLSSLVEGSNLILPVVKKLQVDEMVSGVYISIPNAEVFSAKKLEKLYNLDAPNVKIPEGMEAPKLDEVHMVRIYKKDSNGNPQILSQGKENLYYIVGKDKKPIFEPNNKNEDYVKKSDDVKEELTSKLQKQLPEGVKLYSDDECAKNPRTIEGIMEAFRNEIEEASGTDVTITSMKNRKVIHNEM